MSTVTNFWRIGLSEWLGPLMNNRFMRMSAIAKKQINKDHRNILCNRLLGCFPRAHEPRYGQEQD